MHAECFRYVRLHRNREWARLLEPGRAPLVVEIGSRNINGSVRALFPLEGTEVAYVGIDLVGGPGVDVVADGATWRPSRPAALVLCCEVLEHDPADAEAIVTNAVRMLEPGGLLLITAAADPRAPHGALGEDVPPEEQYGNVDPGRLASWLLEAGAGDWVELQVEHDRTVGDVRAIFRRAA
jgi:hypothetical protein